MEEVKIDGITISKKDIDGKNYYEVRFDYPSESSFKDLIKVIRNEIEEGKLTPLDELQVFGDYKWGSRFNSEVKKIIDEKYPEFPLQIKEEEKVRKLKEFSDRDFIKLSDTIALVRKDKDVKILFKSRLNLEDLEDMVRELKNRAINEVGYGKWEVIPAIYGDVYG